MNDKGPFILCAFGLPQNAHEDDPQRAEAAARKLNAEFARQGLAARCTVTEGVTYCGMIGRGAHYSYTTMGEAVNRAAKLVAASDEPEVIIALRSEPVRPAPISLLEREAQSISTSQEAARLIGRESELSWLAERIETLVAGNAHRAILITGEAGIGKSTLLREMTRRAAGVTVLSSAADSLVGSTTPYAIWRRIFGNLFAKDGSAGSAQLTEVLRRRLERQGEDTSLVDLAGTVLPIAPSGADAGRFSPADRARLTRAVLVALLKDRLSTDRAILLLEDTHWMDAASWALTEELVGKVPQALFILALRTVDDVERHLAATPYERLSLLPVTEKETRSILAQALNCQGVNRGRGKSGAWKGRRQPAVHDPARTRPSRIARTCDRQRPIALWQSVEYGGSCNPVRYRSTCHRFTRRSAARCRAANAEGCKCCWRILRSRHRPGTRPERRRRRSISTG